jgi:ribose/xylose/arabinose/galactoside ABC-type transport system permease subunit
MTIEYGVTRRTSPIQILREIARRREYGVAILLAVTITIVAIANPNFLQPGVLRDVLVNNAPYAIIACGLTFVIVTGEIDISVGSLAGLLAAVMGLLTSSDYASMHVALAVPIVLAIGTFVGLLNGVLVACLRVPSIITTLGMLTALRGVTELLMAGKWIQNLPPGLRFFGTGAILGVPVSIWSAIIVIAGCMVLATRTPLGRRIYAVGSNVHAARLAGLSPRRIKLFAFTFTGFLVAVATLVSVPKLSVIDPGIGKGWELFVVTAVVVGGTSISGGKGTIIGTTLGVLLLGIVGTVLIFLRLGDRATYWERAIQGAFILLAVLVDHLGRRRGESAEEGH